MSQVKEETISELEDPLPRTYGEVLDLHPIARLSMMTTSRSYDNVSARFGPNRPRR